MANYFATVKPWGIAGPLVWVGGGGGGSWGEIIGGRVEQWGKIIRNSAAKRPKFLDFEWSEHYFGSFGEQK